MWPFPTLKGPRWMWRGGRGDGGMRRERADGHRSKVRSLRTKVSTCRRHLPGPFSLSGSGRAGAAKENGEGKKILRFSRPVIHQVSNKSWVFLPSTTAAGPHGPRSPDGPPGRPAPRRPPPFSRAPPLVRHSLSLFPSLDPRARNLLLSGNRREI